MSRIDIGEIQAFLYQLRAANEPGRKTIQSIKAAVTKYVGDNSLKGKAVDASKNYYQMTYFPLCDAIIEAMNESEERLAQYIADFHAQVDGSADARIDADGLYELGKMIDRIEAKKEALAQRMNTGTEGQMQSYRSQLSIAYKQENILEKYLAFEQSHGGFFDNLTDLVQGIQQTIRELQSNIQFNSKTGTYDMSKLNFTTVTRMQNALGKALNDNAKTFNFDEYQKTYRGQMWV
ncbi:T7SS effector LXG polymorphic toxin, partial [Listeria monocytogenes]|uniref:T7SS effector LXG polymorphic toxin n=1 Tax=Listeria monocytogenes TaxID=1639 RepID=UPI001F002CDE